MLLAEPNKLLLVETVSELDGVVSQESLKELEDSVWRLQLVLKHTEQVLRDHDCVPLRLPEDLCLLIELISHSISVTFLQN